MFSKEYHQVTNYLESQLKTFFTKEFGYKRYNSPNTMYKVSNKVDDLLLTLDPYTVMFWHKCLSMLKRNTNPELSCSLLLNPLQFDSLMKRRKYYYCLKELLKCSLLIATDNKKLFIVNVDYANKLFDPKFIPEDEILLF